MPEICSGHTVHTSAAMTQVSAAPNGFDVDEMAMQMVGESTEFYRDLDKFSSSESEGEEESSVMIDQATPAPRLEIDQNASHNSEHATARYARV